MYGFKFASQIVVLVAFIFGVVKLWKKGKPLYFQIIVCAIGCCMLYYVEAFTMAICDVNETYFNNSYWGLFGCYALLLCANRGATGTLFEKASKKALISGVLAGILVMALSVIAAVLFFKVKTVTFGLFLLMQLLASIVVYFNVKHLLTPSDQEGRVKAMRLTDIFSLLFCFLNIVDIACWFLFDEISGISDLVTAFAMVGLSVSAVKGAEKWNS